MTNDKPRRLLASAALATLAISGTTEFFPVRRFLTEEDESEPTQIGRPPRRYNGERIRPQTEEDKRETMRAAEDKRFRKAVQRLRRNKPCLCIEASAIRDTGGKIWSLPRPARHHDVIHLMAESGLPTPIQGEQGFLTNEGTFVDRKVAAIVATAFGQLPNGLHAYPNLYSEDVW